MSSDAELPCWPPKGFAGLVQEGREASTCQAAACRCQGLRFHPVKAPRPGVSQWVLPRADCRSPTPVWRVARRPEEVLSHIPPVSSVGPSLCPPRGPQSHPPVSDVGPTLCSPRGGQVWGLPQYIPPSSQGAVGALLLAVDSPACVLR